jgi:competence protein ComEC
MDRDHFGGFISLVENGRVRSIIKTFPDTTSRKEIKFEEFLKRFGVAVIHPNDTILAVGNSRIYIFKKYVNAEDDKPSMNNRSMVLKVLFGNTSFMFTGDSEVEREYKLISIYDDFLSSDVLKVSHHGSKYCSSEEFLNTVKPKISLISVGFQNKFGHPSQEVLERLGRINSKVFRTDLQGAVLLVSNGYVINTIDYKNL